VVGDAVFCEPVSGDLGLNNSEFTGKSAVFRPITPEFGRFYTKEQWLVAKFPKAPNREFFSPQQGKSDGRTGSSARAFIDCGLPK
jgi:hypothetical protein